MTRKDFQLMADCFSEARSWESLDNTERQLIGVVAAHMADKLETTNPRFDRERFLEACGC